MFCLETPLWKEQLTHHFFYLSVCMITLGNTCSIVGGSHSLSVIWDYCWSPRQPWKRKEASRQVCRGYLLVRCHFPYRLDHVCVTLRGPWKDTICPERKRESTSAISSRNWKEKHSVAVMKQCFIIGQIVKWLLIKDRTVRDCLKWSRLWDFIYTSFRLGVEVCYNSYHTKITPFCLFTHWT